MRKKMSRSNSIRTIRGIGKGKAKAEQLAAMIAEVFMVAPALEYRFAAEIAGGTGAGVRDRLRAVGLKDWRFDLAIPEYKIAIEFDGGGFIAGRHNRGMGVISDMHKINTAVIHGWRVLRYTHTHHKLSDIMRDIALAIPAP